MSWAGQDTSPNVYTDLYTSALETIEDLNVEAEIHMVSNVEVYRQQNTLMSNYTEEMSLVPDDRNGGVF